MITYRSLVASMLITDSANPVSGWDIARTPELRSYLSNPLAISPIGLEMLRSAPSALNTRDGAPLKGSPQATTRGRVALVPVQGPLSTRDSWINRFFGSSSYEVIARDFLAALDNDDVAAIVLDIDSPGGDASGCGELGKLIASARGRKPIVAYCGGAMCSAAYWLGSAADRIVTDGSGMLGSIGVRTVMVDVSKALDAIGVKEYPIVSSQSPHKVLDAADEKDRARVEKMVTDMATVFIADVAKYRGTTTARVESDFGGGDVIVGALAVKAGLADEVGDLDSLVQKLNATADRPQGVSAHQHKGKSMSVKSNTDTTAEGKSDDMECAGCSKKMSANAKAYCAKCWDDGDDDEDDTDASALRATLHSITGEHDDAKAIGVLLALKGANDELQKARAELDGFKKQRADQELESLLASVAPAQRDEVRALAGKYGIEAAIAFLGVKGQKAPAQPRDPSAQPTPEQNAVPKGDALGAVPPDQRKLFQATGLSPEKFREAQKRYAETLNLTPKADE